MTIIMNCFMIYLIIKKSPKEIGRYRYLMLYISFFEIIYCIAGKVVRPFVHSYGSRAIIIVEAKDAWVNRTIMKVINSVVSGCYGCSSSILAIHFMYRYGSLHVNHRNMFEGWKFVAWCFIPASYGAIWSLTIFFIFPDDDGFTELIRSDILETFDWKMEDIVYTGFYYFREDKNGLHGFEPLPIVGMCILWSMMTSSSFVVYFFGYRCYKLVSTMTKNSFSSLAQGLQHQLFKALVWQTVIPIFMVYIPSSLILICPLFNINLGRISVVITVTMSIFTALDPLPNIFIIKNYKRATYQLLCSPV
ncbi:Serpentine receptor class r-10 [Caenorhabditis elegans]|nr:Seven TM Receptor [Caenorhabditis elegans]CCD71215.1 Seven TM Receptor [Caenorhabditis elegans]|eukprot:NP_001024132.1 Seven TM Receptor [Caenorhabditis elegans]